MTTGPLYCWDTSGFLDGYVRRYPPGVFASLWDRVEGLCEERRVLVPEEVFRELRYHHDAAYRWVKDREDSVIVPTDGAVVTEVRRVLAAHAELAKEGSTRNRADPFVIATASLKGARVITGEIGGTARSPKIPYVCDQLGVAHGGFLSVVEQEGWSF